MQRKKKVHIEMHLESVYCEHLHYLSNRHTLVKLEARDQGMKWEREREREREEKRQKCPKRKYN